MLGVGQDITERKMVEIEKATLALELQAFIDTANAPIFGIDHMGITQNPNLQTTNYELQNVHPKPSTLNPQPSALHPQPSTLNPQAYTPRTPNSQAGMVNEWNNKSVEITGFSKREVLHPTPYTTHPTLRTLHSTPYTLHPTPYTQHPTPYTLHPTQVMGQDLVAMYITEDFRESVQAVLVNAQRGEATSNFEFPIFTKDRRRIEILLNATPRCNVMGEVRTTCVFVCVFVYVYVYVYVWVWLWVYICVCVCVCVSLQRYGRGACHALTRLSCNGADPVAAGHVHCSAPFASPWTATLPEFVSHNVSTRSFLSSQFTDKIINLFFTIPCHKINLTDLWVN